MLKMSLETFKRITKQEIGLECDIDKSKFLGIYNISIQNGMRNLYLEFQRYEKVI